jgi:Histidine phosphotransferase C-terminal domain
VNEKVFMIGVEAAIRIVELASVRLCDGVEVQDRSRTSVDVATRCSHPSQALRRAAWLPCAANLPLGAIEGLADGLPGGVRLDTVNLVQTAVFPPGTGRVLLNLLLLAADSLPGGGSVALAGSVEDIFVRITGPGAAWPANFAALVHDEAAALAALPTEAGLQAALTVLLAAQEGLRLSFVIPPPRQPMTPILRLSR